MRLFAVIATVLVLASGCGFLGGGPDSQWKAMQSRIQGHLQDAADAQRVGNQQGELNAHTKLVKDCRDAAGYRLGYSDAEQHVRDACRSLGLSIPLSLLLQSVVHYL